MSDLVVLLMFSIVMLNSCEFRSWNDLKFLVLDSVKACTVLIFDDIRLCIFTSFLLYTNKMLIADMLTRIRNEEERRIVLIRVL